MLQKIFRANFITTGLAMFAMFFGSGNLIFPVAAGQIAGDNVFFALLGIFFTAILMPFFALTVILLFNGDYNKFFSSIGVVPGKIIAFLTLAVIGPFGVLPRCIAFSYATFSIYFQNISLLQFAVVAVLLIYFLTANKSDVVGIIGNLLTPILLVSLVVIIFRGLSTEQVILSNQEASTKFAMFKMGLTNGYKTADIFAALFFATAIIPAFSKLIGPDLSKAKKQVLWLSLRAGLVGMILLFLVYGGLAFVAANLRGALLGVPGDKLLGIIANLTLGQNAGLLANIAVSLACLTTAISLALVSAEFIKEEIFLHKISYGNALILTLVISLGMSLLGFSGIMNLIVPILLIICPAIIVLVITSALKLAFGFRYIKEPVYIVLIFSLLFYLVF